MTSKLILPPDQSSYSVGYGNDILAVRNDSPGSAVKRNQVNNSPTLDAVWICEEDDYNYLVKCHRASVTRGGERFRIDLMLDDSTKLVEYYAKFVPGTFKLTGIAGATYYVSAQLEIEPIPYDTKTQPFVTPSSISDRRMLAANATFTLTGQSVVLRGPARLNAARADFNLFGQSAELTYGFRLTAAQAAYALSGQAVDFLKNAVGLTAAQASFALSGQANTLQLQRNIAAAQASFTMTSPPTGLALSRPAVFYVPWQASITLDCANYDSFHIVLGGNTTLNAPINMRDGQVINVRLEQDLTGSRTITFNAVFKFQGNVVPTISTVAGTPDLLSAEYRASNGNWICGYVKTS